MHLHVEKLTFFYEFSAEQIVHIFTSIKLYIYSIKIYQHIEIQTLLITNKESFLFFFIFLKKCLLE